MYYVCIYNVIIHCELLHFCKLWLITYYYVFKLHIFLKKKNFFLKNQWFNEL